MKLPMPPPDVDSLLRDAARRGRLEAVLSQMVAPGGGAPAYLPWDRPRFRTPPGDLTAQEWWLGVKLSRRSTERVLPSLVDVLGRPFRVGLPDELLESIDDITRAAGESP